MSTPGPDALAEGRFRLLGVIGEGGMATVYRAFDQRLQRPRAIKVLSPALAGRPSLRQRFLAEAQTMATLEESRVVRVFDMGEDGDRVFIVMELIEGGSLLERVRDFGPLPPRMAARVAIQVCESLQIAHDAGVIHRDIKPHNILLTRGGEIRITDFGIAQVQREQDDGLTRTGAVMGTWGFMAPEQKTNAKQVDGRADLFSVGATLWSILRNDMPPELFMADSEPAMLDGVPDELAEVIKRATRYRREERYPTASSMADSLRAFLPMLDEDPEFTVPLVPPGFVRVSSETSGFHVAAGSVSEPRAPAGGTLHPAALGGTIAPSTPPRTQPDPYADPPPARRSGGMAWLLAVPVVLFLAVGAAGAAYVLTRPDPVAPVAAVAPPEQPVTAASGIEAPVEAAPVAPVAVDPSPVAATPVEPVAAARPDARVPTRIPVATPVAAPVAPAVVEAPVAAPVVAPAPGRLSHVAPGSASVGDTLSFRASIGGDWSVKLYYRGAGELPWQEKAMVGDGGTFVASLKVGDAMASGVEYFLAATDSGGATVRDGSAMRPHKVRVGP